MTLIARTSLVSSLGVGPEKSTGSIPPTAKPPAGWIPDPDLAAFRHK